MIKNTLSTHVQPTFFYNFDSYREQVPASPHLRQYVSSFYEIITSDSPTYHVPVVPDGCMDIVFISDGKETKPFILKTAETLLGMYVHPHRYVIGVRFQPVGISKFVRFYSPETGTYMLPLYEFIQKDESVLRNLISDIPFEEKCILLENFLTHNLINADTNIDLTFQIANYIISQKGLATIDQVSREFFYSTRYINRLFNDNVGISPKRFSEIIQMQNLLVNLQKSSTTLADAAVESGYYDQSHMNHIIKRLLHTTSSKLKNNQFFEETGKNLNIKYIY